MTFGKLNAVSMVAGVVYGVALFSLVYGFRDAFAATVDLSIGSSWRASTIVILPGIAVGWGLAVLGSRIRDECGARLVVPLLLFVVVAVGTSIALERQFAQPLLGILAARSILAGVATAVTATIHRWMDL